jgi:3-hydroxyacyl-CoA dehydrogenase
MEKVFLIGDNQELISELSESLKFKYDIAEELDETVEFVFELTGYNSDVKFNILNFIDEKNSKAIIISSSLCITALEQSVNSNNPERIVGASMYPSFTETKGVEIARTKFTSDENFDKVKKLFENIRNGSQRSKGQTGNDRHENNHTDHKRGLSCIAGRHFQPGGH